MSSSEIGKSGDADRAASSKIEVDSPSPAPVLGPSPDSLLGRNPWLIYVLPFIVFMLVNQFEPKPPSGADSSAVEAAAVDGETASGGWFDLGIAYQHYPLVYAAKIALTLLAMALVWPGYRQFPCRFSPLALLVGAVGAVAWIGLCHLQLEARLLGPLGLGSLVEMGERSAFNPFVELDSPAAIWGFLAIRFFGLVAVVALIEEFFLRGFLMRFPIQENWWEVPFGTWHLGAIALGTGAAVLMHPAEMVAALVWFSAVTWLMLRTRNIWDCVAAHAVTNLLLGLYVVLGDRLYGADNWWLM